MLSSLGPPRVLAMTWRDGHLTPCPRRLPSEALRHHVVAHTEQLARRQPVAAMAARGLGAALVCLLVGTVPQHARGQQLTIGSGSSLRVSANLSITSASVSCILSDGLTNVTSTCLQVSSLILPDHPAGPWCSGGFWSATADGVAIQVQLGGIAVNCNCQRNSCTSTCGDVCLECPLQASQTPYLIPLVPQAGAATLSPTGDNNHGQGIALNGVVLAPADPYAFLTSANNIAPLDQYGGHATLQFIYHYHGIPTSFFNCSQGWDALHFTWASAAPNGQHSPQIGWMLDGLPQFGPYSNGGTVPTDLNSCRSHSHTPYGMHYHAGFAHDVTNSFLGCFTYRRAIQSWDAASNNPPQGGPGPGRRLATTQTVQGVTFTCPATTTEAAHTTFSKYAANISTLPAFVAATCGVATASSPPPPSPPGTQPAASPPPPSPPGMQAAASPPPPLPPGATPGNTPAAASSAARRGAAVSGALVACISILFS